MKVKVKYIFSLIILIVLIGCKKEEKTELEDICNKQLPGDYFPAFPNSYWIYHDENNDLVKYYTSSNYSEYGEKCYPVLDNMITLGENKAHIDGNQILYSYYCGLGAVCDFRSTIYSLTLDSIINCPISFSTLKWPMQLPYNIRRVTTNIDTTIIISDSLYANVIIVKEYDTLNMSIWYLDYFSKNIGLIRRDSVNVNDTANVVTILTLNDYYIGD